MPDSLVECNAASKRFGKIEALRELTFSVLSGEILGFIGPNGCGKTTSVRTLLGFYRLESGRIRVLGHDPFTEFQKIGPKLGVMLDQPGLFDALTANEYLSFYAGLFGATDSEVPDQRARILETVGLLSRANDKLGSLSKGMRQRLSFARCLLNRPQLLILDEPFDGIDAEARRDMVRVLPKIAQSGAGIFLTSHNLHEIQRICHRVAIVNHGHVLHLGTPDELRHKVTGKDVLIVGIKPGTMKNGLAERFRGGVFDPARSELRIDLTTEELDRDGIIKILVDNDVSILGIKQEEMSLEDAYFVYTKNGDLQ